MGNGFFSSLFIVNLGIELNWQLNQQSFAGIRTVLRATLAVSNAAVTVWAFRSRLADDRILRFPPFIISFNFALSFALLVFSQDNVIIVVGTYLIQANLYIISFAFFVRHQGATLLFGGVFLSGAVLLFQYSIGSLFANEYDEQAVMRAYSYILLLGILSTTVLVTFSNRFSGLVIRRLNEQANMLRKIAYTDQTTGLPNGLQFELDMGTWTAANRNPGPERLLMVGFRLDGLESLNEQHGLEFTNGIVGTLSARYRDNLERLAGLHPDFGTPEGFDTLYRVEGNSFVFLIKFPGLDTGLGTGTPILKKVIDDLSAEYRERIDLAFQGGFTAYPDDAGSLAQLFKNLLNLIHSRRNESLGTFVTFDQDRYREHLRRETLRGAIARGIRGGEFYLAFQPKVSSSTGRIEGFEALARWVSPEYGSVSPAEFIPLAEEAGEIRALTEALLLRSIDFLALLSEHAFGALTVSVNLSPGTIQSDFLARIAETLEGNPHANRLEFEITEGIVMKMTTETAREFHRLRVLGARFSIDDFGTGYSNLGYLQSFEAEVLKIDKRFIDGIPLDEKNGKLVVTIMQMAKSFGMKVVAEGVEYAEQLRFLRENGCDTIQGYLFSKPLSPEGALAYCEADARETAGL